MANLAWANTYISDYVMHDSVGIIVYTQHVSASYKSVYIFSTISKHTLSCNRHEIECFILQKSTDQKCL